MRKYNLLTIIGKIIKTTISCPLYYLFCICCGGGHGITTALITIATNYCFSISERIVKGAEETSKLYLAIIILIAVIALNHIFMGLHNTVIEKYSYDIQKSFQLKIQNKVSQIDSLFFEDSNNLDWLNKSNKGTENATFFLNVLTAIIFYYIPYFLFITLFFTKLSYKLLLILILLFIPQMFAQILRMKCYTHLEDTSAPIQRRYLHYEACICDKKFYKETRLLGAYDYFFEKYKKTIHEYNCDKWHTDCKALKMQFVTKIITLCGYLFVIFLLVREVIHGDITSANFLAIFTSLYTMLNMMNELLDGHITRLSNQIGSMQNMFSLLDYNIANDFKSDQKISEYNIKLNNVSFSYPNASYKSLNNITLELDKGETLAIIGENGSGKTTLAKIMLGIYPCSSGDVLINNQSMKLFNARDLYSNVSIVLQNYQKYELSILENVGISNSGKDFQKHTVSDLLCKVGLKEDFNNYSYNTILSREFGGIEISGGQWQKIAIARGMYRDCDALILDEPTSAIDPLQQEKMYRLFKEISKGKTTILITHNLAATRLADKIAVMNQGKLIEFGLRTELLEKHGAYYDLYKVQKSIYKF